MPARSRPLHRRRRPYVLLGAALLLAAIAGAATGYFLRFDLPDVRGLEDYIPPVMTRVFDADGEVVATFAEQRRLLIAYEDITPEFQSALMAIEDSDFLHHTGIDFKGILRAAWSDLRHLKLAQGASTLTQQLARNLFLHPDKTIRRKIQEVLLALEIERQYTKQEILRFYCNQIYMGHGRYGLEAAARYYFGKPARELSLTESATIAGLIQRPEALSPFKNPQRALERRNHVLRRMAEEGTLAVRQATEAQKLPLDLSSARRIENPAPYFVEEVRRWLQERYGSSGLYNEGFEAQTTLDRRLQAIANRAMDFGLRELDKRQGWRGVQQRVPEGEDPAQWESPGWETGIRRGEVADGVVLTVEGRTARLRVGPYAGTLGPEEIAWTGSKGPAGLLRPGDVVRVRLVEIAEDGSADLTLEQEPLAEAALIALDPTSGEIKALVGGFDFGRSEFDRAIQAKRQTGSAFKPLVYAAALANDLTLADTILDEPTVFLNRKIPEPYQPENYTNKYYETVTLRTAMEKSANIATVKLLDRIGYRAVIEMARKLGIASDLHPFPSLALGVFEISLLELTSAYGTFANGGVHVEPHLVREVHNRDGALVHRVEPAVRDALDRQIAHLMNRVLKGVITDGTGSAAASLELNLAGKTGTTDDNTDAWFVGYSPNLAVGVWVGFDEPRSLGSKETGAQAALPIWQTFMKEAFEGVPVEDFEQPAEMVTVYIDRRTGLRADRQAGCSPVIREVFVRGTEPTAYCSEPHHQQLGFPYPFQRYAINERGALVIPEAELERLLDSEPSVFLVDGGNQIEAYTGEGRFGLAIERSPGGEPAALPTWLTERYDPAEWIGHDGRAARVLWVR